MMNEITSTMILVANSNYIICTSEKLQNPGTINCKLAKDRGGVYGFAIRLENEEKKIEFFNQIINSRKHNVFEVGEWKSIGNNYYPLYWGKDSNLGFRLFEHMKKSKSSASIDLSDKIFLGQDIIYGAILCKDNKIVEKNLHKDFKDLLRNA